MTKRLILMRHAKSAWGDLSLDDKDRPLNGRGRAAASALGRWLADGGYQPDSVLCSSAARTRETCDRLGLTDAATFLDALYLAPADRMMTELRAASGDSVLMIGHNPGIEDFAERILSDMPDPDRFLGYPTGATLVCDLPIKTWADAAFRSAHLVDFVIPRDLPDQ